MGEYNILKNVKDGEYFKIDLFALDEKNIEFLKNIMINEGDVIRVIRREEEPINSIVVETKEGTLVSIYGSYAEKCYGFIIEPKINKLEKGKSFKKRK